MLSLKKNWLVVSNTTLGIWAILTQLLKSLKISLRSAIFVQSIYMQFELKKIQKSHLSWHWTVMQNWINSGLVVSKMTWGIGWIFIRALKSLKNCALMGPFCPKYMFQLEHFRGIMCHDTKGWSKISKKTDLWLEI